VHIVAGIYSTWKLPKGPEPEVLRSGKVRTDKQQEDEQKIARIVFQAIKNEEDRKKDRKARGIKKMSLLEKLEEAKAYLSDMRGAKEKDVKDAEKAVEKAEADLEKEKKKLAAAIEKAEAEEAKLVAELAAELAAAGVAI
jgi:hypothetical protein